jgi:hypothetical protein
MEYNFSYEIIQVGTETKNRIENVVTEIRFFHCLNDFKRLYVVHLLYENIRMEDYLLYTQVKKEGNQVLHPWIENTLGVEQIGHMKNLLIEDSKNTKKYIDV